MIMLIFTKSMYNAMRLACILCNVAQTLSLDTDIFSYSDNLRTLHTLFHFIHSTQQSQPGLFPHSSHFQGLLYQLVRKGKLGSRLLDTVIALQKFPNHQRYRRSLYIVCNKAAEKTNMLCSTVCKERAHSTPGQSWSLALCSQKGQ